MQESEYILFSKYLIEQYDEYELSKYLNLSTNKISDELKIFVHIIESVNGSLIYPLKITSSSGSLLAFIFPCFVIKLFQSNETFNKEKNIIENCSNNIHIVNGIEHVCVENSIFRGTHSMSFPKNVKIDKNCCLYASITEKLQLITTVIDSRLVLSININSTQKLMKLFIEIGVALEKLHTNGIQHGDCRLDNIGYLDERFILFDFNASNENTNEFNYDICSLVKSVKFYLANQLDYTSLELLNFIKLSRNGDKLIDNVITFYKEYYDNKDDYQVFQYLCSLDI